MSYWGLKGYEVVLFLKNNSFRYKGKVEGEGVDYLVVKDFVQKKIFTIPKENIGVIEVEKD